MTVDQFDGSVALESHILFRSLAWIELFTSVLPLGEASIEVSPSCTTANREGLYRTAPFQRCVPVVTVVFCADEFSVVADAVVAFYLQSPPMVYIERN